MSSDLFWVSVNIVLCLVALIYNWHEARHGLLELRWVAACRVAGAAVYIASCTVLFFGLVDRLVWSHIMIAVSPYVWASVWIAPAVVSRRIRTRIVSSGVVHLDTRRKAS